MAFAPVAGTAPDTAELLAIDAPVASASPAPWPRPAYAWYALSLFTLATMMNFLDRSVFTMMIELIKHDLHLSDVELGLLLGPAGVLFYVFVGVPLARLVDIYPRNIILAVGLCITSGLTSLGGLAQGYWQLFSSRMFVGVGGSAHAPRTYSMMSDLFSPKRLPRAMAVLQAGFIFGTGIAMIAGGAVVSWVSTWQPTHIGPLVMHGWQWVLFCVGLPGLVIAGFIFALPEPKRRGRIAGGRGMPLSQVVREVLARRQIYFPLFIGLALSAIEAQGLQEWRAPFMMRTYHWTPAQIGAWGGVTVFVAMPLGVVFGTWLTERLSRKHKDAPVRTTAIVFAMAVPFAALSPLMPTGELAVIFGAFSAAFGMASSVPQNAAIQTVTPNEMRGQVTAIYLFMYTVFGALGSFLIALVTRYVVGDEQKLWLSMALTAGVLMPLAVVAIARGMKPYGREIARLEAEGLL